MKKTIKSIFLSSFVVLSLAFAFVLTACGKTKTTLFVDKGEVGEYYSSALVSNATLSLDKNAFTLNANGATLKGTYSFDGSNLVLTFEGDATGVNVNFTPNMITFTYKDNTYTLYRNLNYTVSFNSNGGSGVASQTVRNGQKANKPQDPTKEGYTFIGWYKDSAFNTAFDFDSDIVTADTTLYASFGENTSADSEFSVSYVSGVDGVNFDSTTTFHNTVYNLPTVEASGKEFAGWWVSDYEDPNKLSYKFETGMKLYEDTVLYAVYNGNNPLVSVVGDNISWDSKGIGKTYAINVIYADDSESTPIYSKSVATTSESYSFSTEEAGNYIVEVTTGNYTGRAYFVNKGLDNVSKISADGFTLSWNKVANATNYDLVIDNGNPNQSATVNLGNVNTYDFTNLTMPKTGINFKVVAKASGYASSSSKVFNLSRSLDSIQTVNYDSTTQSLSWAAVDGATSYKVEVTDSNSNTQTYSASETSFVIDAYYGAITYSVTPMKDGWYSEAKSGDMNKSELSTPKNINMVAYDINWDAVTGAASYVVTVNGQDYNATTNSYTLTAQQTDSVSEFVISVQAVASSAANNSLKSSAVTIRKGGVTQVSYANGVVSWNSVPGVAYFAVKVDNGEAQLVANDNKVNMAITSGAHSIYVAPSDSTGNYNEADLFKYDVNVYALNYNTLGGEEMAASYFVKGDNIPALSTPNYLGYHFVDWYVSEDAAKNNGDKFTAQTFDYDGDVTIYAGWAGNEYTVTLDYTAIGIGTTTTMTVTFGSEYTLPSASTNSNLKAFIGWFAEVNEVGEQYTDEFGSSIRKWRDYHDVTLHAGWADVFSFTLLTNDTYSVSKGAGISYVTEVTIPYEYEGKAVSTVEAGAFQSCSNITKINIPNSIRNIEVGSEGPNGTGSAFQGCSKLTGLYMYEVEGTAPENIFYETIDGVLIFHNSVTGGVELSWFPYYTKGGIYTVPSIVTVIPVNAFKSCSKLEEIIIPASVVEIQDNAFTSCSKLTTVTFLAAAEGETEKELKLGKEVFKSDSLLEEVTLPARIDSFTATTFASCSALKSVNIAGDYENAKFKSVNGVVYSFDMTTLIFYPKAKTDTEFTVPTGVTTIGPNAFENVKGLTLLTIPGQVQEIGRLAFKGCSNLTNIIFTGEADDPGLTVREQAFYNAGNAVSTFTELTLPANLVGMEKSSFGGMNVTKVYVYSAKDSLQFAPGAFGSTAVSQTFNVTDLWLSKDVHPFDITGVFGSIKLLNVVVEEGNTNYATEDGVLYDYAITQILYYPTEKAGAYEIPNTIQSIGARVFESKTGLTSINIPVSVTSIGEYAFKGCNKLTTINFAQGEGDPLSIAQFAFQGCNALTSINLPDRTAFIGNSAFISCSALTTFNVPKNATLSEDTSTSSGDKDARIRVFDSCTRLQSITVSEGNTTYKSIDGVLYKLVYDNETLLGYNLILCPRGKSGTLEIPKETLSIASRAFMYQEGVTSVTFPEGVETDSFVLGAYAFYYCDDSLANVELPHGIANIPEWSFYYCKALTSVTIPNTVSSIGKNAFYWCTNLETVTFEEGNTSNPLVFENGSYTNSGSESSTGSASVSSVFYGCNKIETLVLPERTSTIGTASLAGMSGLKNLTIPASVTSIGERAFTLCDQIQNLTFVKEGSQLESIGNYAFYDSNGSKGIKVTTLSLPDSLKSIGTYAFAHMTATTLELGSGLETISNGAFEYCYSLTSVVIPASVKTINNYGFYRDNNLKTVTFAPNSQIETIGQYAFQYCISLEAITFPTSIKKIDQQAFDNCYNLASIAFEGDSENPSHLNTIGYKAFARSAITEFRFPNCGKNSSDVYNKITIGNSTTVHLFEGCKKLKDVYISGAVTTIDKMFVKCTSIENIYVVDDNENLSASANSPVILNVDGTAIRFVYGRQDGVFTIPDGVTDISSYAFAGQANMTKVIIPSSIKTIGTYAFQNCLSLETVEFASGSTIDTIDNYTFADCIKLKNINLPNTIIKINQYAFAGCKSLESFTWPTSITTLGNGAFTGSGLKTVTVPGTITSFGDNMFKNCHNLETAVISNGITKVGTYTFDGCEKLSSVTLSTDLTYLPQYMFQNCTGLTSITVPENVTRLGGNASSSATSSSLSGYVFAGCTNLESLTMSPNVANLGSYLFKNCAKLTSIEFTNKLKYIGGSAFRGSCFETITFASDTAISALGDYAFAETPNLNSIALPGGTVTKVSNYAFDASGVRNVTFNSKYTQIGNYVFRGTTRLESITFPSTITTIGTYLFQNSTSIETVVFEANKMTFGNWMFQNCSNLKNVTLPAGQTSTLGTYVFQNCTSLESIVLPDGITTLGNYSFEGCTSLKNVTLPSALTSIGTYFFQNCTSLETITLPSKLVKVGGSSYSAVSHLFDGCTSLKTVNINGALTYIGSYVFANCTSLSKINFNGGTASLTQIGNNAFQNTPLIDSFDFTKITAVGELAFEGSAVRNVALSKSVTTIGNGAFNGMLNLESLTIDEENTKYMTYEDMAIIDKSALAIVSVYNASGDVTIPEGIKVNPNAFYDCEDINTLTIPGTYNYTALRPFSHFKGKTIIVSEGVETISQYMFEYGSFENIVLPSTITKIDTCAFIGCTGLKSIVLPDSLETIGTATTSDAFKGCTALESVTFGNNFNMLGNAVFRDCTNLKSITLPSTLETIGNYAFCNTGLESITIPASVKSIGNYSFSDCMNLTTVVMGMDNTESWGTYVFANDDKLTSVTLPAHEDEIGQYAFQNCTSLVSITLPESLVSINNYAFNNCTALKNIALNSKLENIGQYAFAQTAIESITLPSTMQRLGQYAFLNCTALKTVVIEEGLEWIGGVSSITATSYSATNGNVFQGCTALESINIPDSVQNIGANTFEGCTSLMSIVLGDNVQLVSRWAFKGWTSAQKVYITQSLYDVAVSWEIQTTSVNTFSVFAETEAEFIWEYEIPQNQSGAGSSSEDANDGAERP